MKPQLIVEQKITAFVNKYVIFNVDDHGEKGQCVALAQQKRLAFKEKVIFYTNEEKTTVAFTFRAEKVFDVHGKYIVEDSSGNVLGGFKKQFKQSLLKSTWHIVDSDNQPQLVIAENNLTLALIRRFAGFIPIIGDLIEIIVLFFRYHFSFTDPHSDHEVGRYQKTTILRDHYLLSKSDILYSTQDWRVFAAMAVALDALQSR